MKTMYDYGLTKIYELVINTNPSLAFLLENNSTLENKMVIAHVLGHTDFFKHNLYFGHTSRQMVESAGAQRRAHRPLRVRARHAGRRAVPRRRALGQGAHLPAPVNGRAPTGADTGERAERARRRRRTTTCGDSTSAASSAEDGAAPGTAHPARARRPTCCSFLIDYAAIWRTGSATSSPSCARRCSTSCRRCRPRS